MAVNGRTLDLSSPEDRLRLGVAYVGQSAALGGEFRSWKDAEALAFAGREGLRNEPVVDVLKEHAIEAGWLSGDLVPARFFDLVTAVLSVPTVLLLDEIGARVESSDERRNLYELIKGHLPETAVVFVEHDQPICVSRADKLLVLGSESGPRIEDPRAFDPDEVADAHLPSGGAGAHSWFEDAQRLLEWEEAPRRLLKLCLMAGAVKHVNDWMDLLEAEWSFLRKPRTSMLSGGQRIILTCLARSASGCGRLDDRLRAHVHAKTQERLRAFEKALASSEARRGRTAPSKILADSL
jgi:hypothetical protein